MKLFYLPGACSLAPHIVLEWVGADYELVRVERGKTREPEYLKINPAGKVPALIEDDGWVLTEAEAILLYLAERYPAHELGPGPSLEQRHEMHKWLSYLTGDVHPAFYPFFGPQRYIGDEELYDAVREAAVVQIDAHLRLLDDHMENRAHMVEDRRTVLDAYLYVFIRWTDLTPTKRVAYPNLHRFAKNMIEYERVRRALEAQRIDP